MTKKDFELIAKVLSTEYYELKSTSKWSLGRSQVIIDVPPALAAEFEEKFPRFNRSKFMLAIVGYVY